MRRRSFIKSAVTAVGGGLLAPQLGEAAPWIVSQPEGVAAAGEASGNDWIPDTLDLADRGALSINALTGAADPQLLCCEASACSAQPPRDERKHAKLGLRPEDAGILHQ
jgi:hypothetical protein